MEFIGSIEADFQGATEYSSGGLGPFFKSWRLEAPFSVYELAYRLLGAFQKLGVKRVDALFFDEEAIYEALDELCVRDYGGIIEELAGGSEGGAEPPRTPAKAHRKRVGRSKKGIKSRKQRRARAVAHRPN